MVTLAQHDLCSGCSACFAACPKHAIAMVPDQHGALYPKINPEKCVACHICEKACYIQNQYSLIQDENPLCYAAYSLDESLRMASSSGGIFSELANLILEQNGLIFGCVFDGPECNVIHISVDKKEDLAKMRGSKYVQSDLQNTFIEGKRALDTGRKVLFSGTPCQIAGLNRFLAKDYPNLITVEVICHGAPVPGVWKKYLHDFRKQYKMDKINSIFFRNKDNGWKRFRMYTCGSAHGSDTAIKISRFMWDDSFMRAFLLDYSLRLSCYNCKAKSGASCADITLGDFWGIEHGYINFPNDDKGISAVILHSEKGKHLFQSCNERIRYCNVSLQNIIRGNPAYIHSAVMPRMYKFFMNSYRDSDFEKIVAEVYILSLPVHILRKLLCLPNLIFKRMLKK